MRRFVLIMLLCFVTAALVRVDFAFSVALLLGFVYLFVRVIPERWARNVTVERHFLDRAFPGDRVEVEVVARNRGILPVPWVEAFESMPAELTAESLESRRRVFSLGSRDERTVSYQLHCRARGVHAIGPMTLRTGDVLGIRETKFASLPADHLIVYPHVVPLDRLGFPTRSPLAVLPHRAHLFEDPTRVRGVRDYRAGDSQRRIHWTATARTGSLLVRQFEPAVARDTVVCLDLDVLNYYLRSRRSGPELGITVAASVANHAINRENLTAGLLTEAFDPIAKVRGEVFLPPRSGRGNLMNLLEMLARLEPDQELDFPALLRRRAPSLPWGTTLVVVTGSAWPELVETLVYLRGSGFAMSVVLVQPDLEMLQSAELMLRSAGIRNGAVFKQPYMEEMRRSGREPNSPYWAS